MTAIKICGLRRLEDVMLMNELRPDFVGFVFAKSRRKLSLDEAEELSRALIPEIKKVGVFVNADFRVICELADKKIIDYVQLHGDEDADYIAKLRRNCKLPIIKACHMVNTKVALAADQLNCDYLLLDTYTKNFGGSGICFNHELIPKLKHPYFLAGGLSPENVREAIKNTDAWAVDVSSNLETEGYKDPEKVRTFMSAVRGGENE